MDGDPQFRPDLFHGAADDYERFRLGYPTELLNDLRARAAVGPTAHVLDLACGTGQIARAIAPYVGTVHAVDLEPDMVAVGRRAAERSGVDNVRWTAASAEDVELDGPYDLVTIGNAFHRLQRQVVADRLVPQLFVGGAVALLWSGTAWVGDHGWQQAFFDTLERWQDRLDVRARVPEGWAEAIERDTNEQVLERAGLTYVGLHEATTTHHWTTDQLIGLTYSTSFLNRAVLADHIDEFERDLRERLLACDAAGVFEQELSFAYELARRRP